MNIRVNCWRWPFFLRYFFFGFILYTMTLGPRKSFSTLASTLICGKYGCPIKIWSSFFPKKTRWMDSLLLLWIDKWFMSINLPASTHYWRPLASIIIYFIIYLCLEIWVLFFKSNRFIKKSQFNLENFEIAQRKKTLLFKKEKLKKS